MKNSTGDLAQWIRNGWRRYYPNQEELVAAVETVFDSSGELPIGIPALAVKPTLRGKGIGKAVLLQLLDIHYQQGQFAHVEFIESDNLAARKLVERVGFTANIETIDEKKYIEYRKR